MRTATIFTFVLLLLLSCVSAQAASLHLVKHGFSNGSTNPSGDFTLLLLFDSDMSPEKAEPFITLNASGSDKAVKVTAADEEMAAKVDGLASRTLVVRPVDRVGSGTKCVLSLAPGLKASDGRSALDTTKTIVFKTASFLTIDKVEAVTTGIDTSKVILEFNEAVSRSDLRKLLKVRPYTYCWPYNVGGSAKGSWKIRLEGGFKPGKEYRIVIDHALKSITGNQLESSRTLKVVMPPVSPAISFVEENRVIELKSRQLVHVAVVNVGEVVCEALRLPPELARSVYYKRFVDGKNKFASIEGIAYKRGETQNVVSRLKGWLDEVSSLTFPSPTHVKKDEVKLEADRFFCTVNETQSKAFSIPLTFRDDKEKGGTFLLRVGSGSAKNQEKATTGYRIFQITDLAITVKRANNQLLVWVTSLSTGLPVSGVKLYAETKDFRFDLGKTDNDGLLLVDRKKAHRVVTVDPNGDEAQMSLEKLASAIILAQKGNDYSWVTLEDEAKEIPAGVQAESSNSSSNVKGMAFTERGIYRPGDKVSFKVVFRKFENSVPRVPGLSSVHLVVKGPRGDKVVTQKLELTEFGTAFGTVQMKKFHPLGTYRIYFYTKDDEKTLLTSSTYELQEFRPPRHKVRIDFRTSSATDSRFVDRTVHRDYLTAKIKGLYYAGGPVRHGKVSWNVRYVGTSFNVKGEQDYEFCSHLLGPSPLLENGESMLDEAGIVEVKLPISPEVLSGTMGIEVQATVLDFDGRPATSTEKYTVKPDILIGTSKHAEEVEMGASTTLRAIVLDRNGKRMQQGDVEVEVMRQTYLSVRKRDATGNTRWEGEEVFTRQFRAPIKIVKGRAAFDFDFRNGGKYLLRFHYKGEDGKSYSASSLYQVSGYWYDGDERQKRESMLSLNPDKLTYSSGDKAKIAIRGKRRASCYLLTVERDSVIEHRLVKLPDGKGSVEVNLKSDYAPNVYVSLIAPCGRTRFPIYATEADVFKPVSLFGVARLNVRPASKTLAVEILPDPSDRYPLPGDRMSVTVKVRDGLKKPVNAEVALCVVDEGILALTGFQTPDLTKLFAETLLRLDVTTSDLRSKILAQSPFREFRSKPFTGGGGNERGASGSKVQERKNFDPLAFWAPALVTGSDGDVLVDFVLPDTITAYRVYAVVVDKGARYGSNQIEQKVVKPFYLEPGLPRFLVRGDKLSFSVAMFNKTDHKGKATLSITAPSNVSLEYTQKPVEIGAYASVTVPIKAKVGMTGPAKFSFEGHFEGGSDKVTKSIPVRSRLTMSDRVAIGRLSGQGIVKALLPPDMDDIPKDERSEMSASLTITDNPLIRLAPGLKYLLKYPYGCIEQTSSGVMSLAGLRALVRDGRIPGITLEEADKFLEPGIERILSMQLSDGSFSYWPGSGSTHSWGSAFAAQALHVASQAGFAVPEARMAKVHKYLKSLADGYLKLKEYHTTEALVLYVLASEGKGDVKLMKQLANRMDKFSREAKVVFLLASMKASSMARYQVDGLLQELVAEESANPSKTIFDSHHFGSAVREMAFMLMLSCELDQRASIGASIAERVINKAGDTGRWHSTHDTGWCLLALADYFKNVEFLKSPVSLTVRHGSKNERLTLKPGLPLTVDVDAALLTEKPTLTIESSGNTPLFYNLRYRIPMTEALRRTLAKGYDVKRTYKLAGDSKRAIRVGDIVEVQLDLDIPLRGEYLVLEDPLPAGLVAINSKLKTEPAVHNRADEESNYGWWDGWWAFVPQHVEMKDDRVMAFRNVSWSEHYRYVYYARAVAPGTFTAPSAKVQEMYRPNRAGFSKSQQVVIEAK